MLFDLTNPRRRRVIKVVYAVLAILFGVGFLFFFVGSEVGGGQSVFEAVGIGGASSSEEDINQDEIDDARERLEQNPNDRAALSDLVALY